MSNIIKIYQLTGIKNKNNYKRIINEIKKNLFIVSASIGKNDGLLKIEYKIEDENTSFTSFEDSILKAIRLYEKKAQITEKINTEIYRRVLYLKGLDCGHCATRVESFAKKELNHEKIVVDFATTRFIIETSDKDLIDNIIPRVTAIAHKVDSRIVVNDSQTQKKELNNFTPKVNVLKIILFVLSLFFLLSGFIMEMMHKHTSIWGILDAIHSAEYIYSYPTMICFILSYICVGYQVIINFFKNLFRGHFFDENFLMTIASIGAIAIAHFVEGIMVMMLYVIGDYLQQRAVNHSRKSISELFNLNIQTTKLKINGEIIETEVESVLPDDIIVVAKGESIPLDGIIVEGKTTIDCRNITGESLNQIANVGDEIMAGTVNLGSTIEIRVLRPYSESMIAKILDLVENASSAKAKAENFITKFSKVYTPVVVFLALLIAIIGGTLGFLSDNPASGYTWIYRSLSFLVISCPCALVISIPLCFFNGIGISSKKGILVKGSNYIEALHYANKIIFDKTGTLTKGEFKILEVVPINEKTTKDEVLNLIVYTEFYSSHPIGISIVDSYGRDGVYSGIISDYEDVIGGAKATINGSKIIVGNNRLMRTCKIEVPEVDAPGLVIHVVKERTYLGYLIIGDTIRDGAAEAIRELHKLGVESCYIFTGDSKGIAENVANRLGIDEVYSELLPNEKVEKLEEIITNNKKKTIYVGDGINDAPVISKADVGIAMASSASEATIAIADIVIMGDNLIKLVEAIKIAKETHKKVVENIILCLIVKLSVMILAIIPTIQLPLWIAILSDVGLSLVAILNSFLLHKVFPKKTKGENNE